METLVHSRLYSFALFVPNTLKLPLLVASSWTVLWPYRLYSSIPHFTWCQMPWSLYLAADSPMMVKSRLIVTSFSMLVGRQRLFFSQCYRLQMWFFTPTTPTASLWADIHHGKSHILPFVLAPVTLSPSLVVDDGSWTLFHEMRQCCYSYTPQNKDCSCPFGLWSCPELFNQPLSVVFLRLSSWG